MKEWILILTLVGESSNSGQAIEHIPGFAVKQECETAGSQWLTQVYQTRGTRPRAYLCVERTAART